MYLYVFPTVCHPGGVTPPTTAMLDAQVARIHEERARLEAALDGMPGVRRYPSAANFVLARLPDGPRAFEGLKARGILVRSFQG